MTFNRKYCLVIPLYQALNLSKLNYIYKLELGKFKYQVHNAAASRSFYDRFIQLRDIHSYSIRQKESLVYFKPPYKKTIYW